MGELLWRVMRVSLCHQLFCKAQPCACILSALLLIIILCEVELCTSRLRSKRPGSIFHVHSRCHSTYTAEIWPKIFSQSMRNLISSANLAIWCPASQIHDKSGGDYPLVSITNALRLICLTSHSLVRKIVKRAQQPIGSHNSPPIKYAKSISS